MQTSVDVHAYSWHLGRKRRNALDTWLRANGLHGHHVVRLTLGEGHVIVERLKGADVKPGVFEFEVDENDNPVTFTEMVLVDSLPPMEAFDYTCLCSF